MKTAITIALLSISISALADTTSAVPTFTQQTPISALIEAIPGDTIEIPWLTGVVVRRHAVNIEDNTMANIRSMFANWCTAQSASILQPREHNCALLPRGYLGCAKGELLWGSSKDIAVGLAQKAKSNNVAFQIGWPNASSLISDNLLGNILFNKKEKSIVGELQRCIKNDNQIVAAMIFASIDRNNDLLIMNNEGFSAISTIGKEQNLALAESKRLAEEQKNAARKSALEAMKPGDSVVSKQATWKKGMVIEMKPPLAQVQWEGQYSNGAITEWVKIVDLDLPRR